MMKVRLSTAVCRFLTCLLGLAGCLAAMHQPAAASSMTSLPPGAAATIAQSLQREDQPHHLFAAAADTYFAVSPDLKMTYSFTHEGLTISTGSPDQTHSMHLAGIGYAGRVHPVSPAIPQLAGSSLIYQRGPSATEWYRNSMLGLEQGFTLEKPPGDNTDGAMLTIALHLSGTLLPEIDGSELLFKDTDGNTVSSYGGLFCYDAGGKTLPSRMILEKNIVTLLVDDRLAMYPVTVDPWFQQAKLLAGDGQGNDYFGYSVAVSGDTIVIGAHGNDAEASSAGAVYVFTRPTGGWTNMTHTAKLTAADAATSAYFGSSVAISGDTIVIGAPGDDSSGDGSGAAYVFVKPVNGWADMTQTAKLTAADGAALDSFGASVDISGSTIVIGAPGNDDERGSAYVFVQPGKGWTDMTHTAQLTTHLRYANEKLGSSVSVSDATIALGIWRTPGEAYVYVRPAGGWVDGVATAKLSTPDSQIFDNFGQHLDVGGDTVIVGAHSHQLGGKTTGAVYVFQKPAAGWQDSPLHTAKLTASDGDAGDHFGISLAISGQKIVVGAEADDDFGDWSGAAYVFDRPAAGWLDMTQTGKLRASDGAAGDQFGNAVAMDDQTILIGAVHDDDLALSSGAAYAYSFNDPSGDINQDGSIDLQDAVLSLQVAVGVLPGQSIDIAGDSNSDKKIGLAESIYILNRLALAPPD